MTQAVEQEIVGLTGAAVTRLFGADRYATGAAVAATFTVTRGTAFLATGENFPDALAGVPAAAQASAPILLTRPDALPDATVAELTRLDPQTLYILGGTAAVSDGVEGALVELIEG